MKDIKILVPVDGSYKEYQKYKLAFSETNVWKKISFLVDPSLNSKAIENSIGFGGEYKKNEADYKRCDEILFECGFEGSFDKFCIVEYFQNKMLYHSSRQHREEVARKLIFLYDFIRQLEFDVFLYNTVSHFFPRFTSLVARSMGKEVLGYTQSLVPGYEFIWVSDEQFYSDELIKTIPMVSQESRAKSKLILDEIKEKKRKKQYLSVFKRSLAEEFKSLVMIRNRLTFKTLTKSRLKYWLNKAVINSVRALFWKNASVSSIPSVPFIFFPLHMPGEAQTLVRGYPFINDVEVVQQVSLTLPAEFILLIKEHPGYEGWKSMQELNVIKSLPNVVLVNSEISSHDLIDRAEGIVTINSSVWFEALAFETPVITLGNGTFTGTDMTTSARSYEELRRFLLELSKDKQRFLPGSAEVERFVAAYASVSVKGGFYDYTDNYIESFRRLIGTKVN